ncbi:MAG TPA: site-specific DNA-methyltransferase [Campylobacterales bacterium]|nr:site-specific DNA-methyltransferase [Campylobacterales bacterium]
MTSLFEHKPTTVAPIELLNNFSDLDNREFLDEYNKTLEILKNKIGEPYYANSGYILYHADNDDILKKLSDNYFKVDLTVTSPPYNIGKEYEKNMDTEDYIAWCKTWIDLIYHVTNDNGSFWLNVGYLTIKGKGKAVPISYLLWDKTDFYLMQEIVWKYGAGVTAKKFFAPRNEKFLFYIKNQKDYIFNLDAVRDKNVKYPNQKKNGKLRCNPLGKNPTDVWDFPKVTSGKNRSSKERTSHPAQYPLSVIDRVIKVSSHKYNIVLDPFSGSGTTGIASHGNHRIYIGIEINKDYCDLSIERFENYLNEKAEKSNTLF